MLNRNHDGTYSTDSVAQCAFMAPDPKLMTVNFEELTARHKETIAKREKQNLPVPEGPAKELHRLRHELFNLTERAKHVKIYRDNQAGNVAALEQRTTDAINQKKLCITSGNVRAERNYEHTIKRLERELVDAEQELRRAERQNAQAVCALNAFDGHARIAELVKELETPKIVSK